MNFLLPLLIFLPLAAAISIVLLPSHAKIARWGTLFSSVTTLALSLIAASQFIAASPVQAVDGPVQPRLEFRHTWLTIPIGDDTTRLEFFVGIDGVSLLLVVLVNLLTTAAIVISWESVRERSNEYYALLLALQSGLLGAFCAFDLLLFYVFFEFTLIPLFFLIGIWGGPKRRLAANRFVIYTLAGSLSTLVGIIALGVVAAGRYGLATPFSIPDLATAIAEDPLPYSNQVALFLAIAFGFMVKTPLVPFHTWQPLTYVEAPTGASVLLAGVVMKLGTYGLFRLCLTLLPDASQSIGVPLIGGLAIVGIVYAALCALVQSDIKRLVAYSSISHIGFCLLGLFAFNSEGLSGGVLQMVNHGITTGALFLLVGMIEDRYQTRSLDQLGGLTVRIPILAACMVFICLASIGLPGLNGFVGEFLSLAGMFAVHPMYAVLGTSGIVLGAWYTLSMLQKGIFGPLREPAGLTHSIPDLRSREAIVLLPLMALCLWIGLYPQPLLNLIEPEVTRVAQLHDLSLPSESAVARDEAQPSSSLLTPQTRLQVTLTE